MAVMWLLAVAHAGFWSWGLALGLEAGRLNVAHGLALAGWLASVGLWLGLVG